LQVGSSNFNKQGETSSAPPFDGYQGIVKMLSTSKLKGADFSTRYHNYDNLESTEKGKKTSEDHAPLHIEKLDKETMHFIPKGVYKRKTHNPSTRAPLSYLVVEDLAQTPCAISSLEVLQSFPSQCTALLSTIGAKNSASQLVMKFDVTELRPFFCITYLFRLGLFETIS
jgi:hypothetical protein